MLRFFVLVLLLANAGYYAWSAMSDGATTETPETKAPQGAPKARATRPAHEATPEAADELEAPPGETKATPDLGSAEPEPSAVDGTVGAG